MNTKQVVGFACSYTPLALINAAGFSHYRVLPDADCPDQAGSLLHDNLCPHIKGILDRAMSDRVPDLAGMVFLNSCDAMRRLHDAWMKARPGTRSVLIDLPPTTNDASVGFFRDELDRLAGTLVDWGGTAPDGKSLTRGIGLNNAIAESLSALRDRQRAGTLRNGSAALQEAYNRASTGPMEETITFLESLLAETAANNGRGVPLYLFGNVMPDPEAFTLIEECGARIVCEDMCTGSRVFTRITMDREDALYCMARDTIRDRPCARTMDERRPGRIADDLVMMARECGARGIIGYTVKFCDPYIARMPHVRELLKKEGIPFLHLEGDCTMRSMGQHRTRIEAFIEMLG
ncbi:MAG TPA: 2-hydroxyacyl-CoA dehydratase family protein [Spirochaetota bacterium]|nr:2-hydroxyacyl-CoA dehydratase family protein [Spirochaetota bacterium]